MFSSTLHLSPLQALHLFIADHQPDAEEGSNIELAIQTIGEAQQESLTQELVEFLMGERDNQPKVGAPVVYWWMHRYSINLPVMRC